MTSCAVCNAPPPLTLTRHGLRCGKCLLGELELYRGIVSDLAATEPRGSEPHECGLCGAGFSQPHAESCPWRRAVELHALTLPSPPPRP